MSFFKHLLLFREALVLREEGLKNETSEKIRTKANFYFSHTSTLAHTLMKMDLYRDEMPLLHSNYNPKNPERKWSVNNIGPFSGNLMAVLHE